MTNSTVTQKNLRFREHAVAFIAENGVPFNNALIGITYPDPEYEIKRPASNPITVFEYVLEGEGEIFLNGKWLTVSAGDIYILRHGEDHHYRSSARNPWEKIWINYVADYLLAFLDAYGINSGIYRCENAKAYFLQLFELTKGESGAKNVHLTISELVHKIIHALASERLTESSDEYRIREALNASVYEKLSLDELAAKLYIKVKRYPNFQEELRSDALRISSLSQNRHRQAAFKGYKDDRKGDSEQALHSRRALFFLTFP